jgi:hypothetical protein
MIMQAYQGYYDDGRFRTLDGLAVPERGQAILLFLEAASIKRQEAAKREETLAWLDEFHRLAASDCEELSDTDFSRMRFGRDFAGLSKGDATK